MPHMSFADTMAYADPASADGIRPQFDIFLSHSGTQKGFATDLHTSLTSMSYSVFFDKERHSLPLGQRFPERIFSAANTCNLAVVVLSEEFLMSRWPMIELCTFVDRLSSTGSCNASAPPLTLFPLFLKIFPADVKNRYKIARWRMTWEAFQKQDSRISAYKCEEAVTKVLPCYNGIVRRPESEQGEASYINEVITGILDVLPPRKFYQVRYPANPNKVYAGRERLCKFVLDKFREMEDPLSSSGGDIKASILGMYGVPGSGKSTLCSFICQSLFSEFRGRVIYLELPSELTADAPLIRQYAKLLSKLIPHKEIASMDLNELYNLLLGATFSQKIFLVLDNISASNYRRYKTMVEAILCSGILGSRDGSRVMLVAQSSSVLEMVEVEQYSSMYRFEIIEIPCLTDEEAIEVVRNRYPFVRDEQMIPLLRKSRFRSPFMYVPLIFEQIGILLREKRYHDVKELEVLMKMVDEGKRTAVQELVHMNFKQLREDLRFLFFDIALYIIPAGYSKLEEATPILRSMHDIDISETFKLEWNIQDLRKHCVLSVMEGELRVHDIFVEYARSIPENSSRYINEPSLGTSDVGRSLSGTTVASALITNRSRRQLTSTHDQISYHHTLVYLTLKYPINARTINVGIAPPVDHAIHLRLKVKPTVRAVRVRNNSQRSQCVMSLSGDLSSLICLEIENVHHVLISPSWSATNLANLVRLELRNQNNTQLQMDAPRSGQKRKKKRMKSTTQSITRLSKLLFPWLEPPASHNQLVRNMNTSRLMAMLQVLVLINAGVRRLHDIGHYWPELESLELFDEAQELMSVNIGSAPKLKQLTIGTFINRHPRPCLSILLTDYYHRYSRLRPIKSSKLVLQLSGCPELQRLCVEGSLFDEVEVEGLLSPKLRNLSLANQRSHESIPMKLLLSGSHQLSLLETLELSCKKLERLEFTKRCLGYLPSLAEVILQDCASLTHLYIGLDCLQNLVRLRVDYCPKLELLTGIENLLVEELRWLELWQLPRLQCEIHFRDMDRWEHDVELELISVHECIGVKIDYSILEVSKNLKWIDIQGTSACEALLQKMSDHDILDALMFIGTNSHHIQGITVHKKNLRLKDENAIGLISNQAIISNKSSSADQQKDGTAGITLVGADQHQYYQPENPHAQMSHFSDRLTFSKDRFTNLWRMSLDGLESLREVEGIQHLHKLGSLRLWNLPNLVRVSGKWPERIGSILLGECPMLQEIPRIEKTVELHTLECVRCGQMKAVEGDFREMKRLREVDISECEGMEVFPMKDVEEELGKRSEGYPERWGGSVSVNGSKFARVEVMREWLRRAEFGSRLFEAAAEALIWEHLRKDTPGALDALFDHFSTFGTTMFNTIHLQYLQNLLFPPYFQISLLDLHFQEHEIQQFKHMILKTFPQMFAHST